MRDKINGMSKMMGDMSGRMKQMSEQMEMGTKGYNKFIGVVMFFSEVRAGPPPRPLEPYVVNVKGDQIVVSKGT